MWHTANHVKECHMFVSIILILKNFLLLSPSQRVYLLAKTFSLPPLPYLADQHLCYVFSFTSCGAPFSPHHCLLVTSQDDGHLAGASEMFYRREKIRKTTIMFLLISAEMICPFPYGNCSWF